MVNLQKEYVAGVCNIGKEEQNLRMLSGWIGTGLTVAGGLAFVAFGVPAAWRLTLILPASLAATGFLQAGMHFCAGYGLKGVFNVASEVGVTRTVEQAEFAAKDRAKAFQIFGLSVLIGAAAALAVFLIP